MAINSYDITSHDKVLPMSKFFTNTSKKGSFSNRLDKNNPTTNSSVASITSQFKNSFKSPYLVEDNSQTTAKVTHRKAVQKVKPDFVSSFPLAVNLYKASSDEIKPIKPNKKVKKSVLTLPNEQSYTVEKCTVSDMNDSEYINKDDVTHKVRPKKKIPRQSKKKLRNREFYDMDSRYYSHMNIDVDSSSNDMMRNYDGDGKRVSRRIKPHPMRKCQAEKQFSGHNIWKVLRNMNRFQFRPSPPASDDTVVMPRKKKISKRYKRKDTRFIETCRTEEFAYISNVDMDSKSKSFSQSSSFDRITVIDKQDDFSKLCEEFEKNIRKTHNLAKDVKVNNCIPIKNKNHIKNRPRINKLCTFKDRQMKAIDNTPTVMKNENNFENVNCKGNCIVSSENVIQKPKNSVGRLNGHLNIKKSEHKTQADDEFSDNFVNSVHSGSSKAAFNYLKDTNKSLKISSDESSQYIKGITKVVVSKDQDMVSANRTELQKRKPRLFTKITDTTLIPKLTQTDIKRRLARIKFPLVILEKDQISSAIEVMNFCDHPQFAGLDKHIWPFMLEWNSDYSKKDKCVEAHRKIDNNIRKTRRYTGQTENKFVNIRRSNKIATCDLDTKEKGTHNAESLTNQSIKEEAVPILEMKPKQLQTKDKMLELLYKKSPCTNIHEVTHQIGGGDVKQVVSKNICSKTDINGNRNSLRSVTVKERLKNRQRNPVNPLYTKDRLSIMRPSKMKSINLVETVTMNIENGVYYNEDQKYFKNEQVMISKEASIQTTVNDIAKIQTDQIESLKSSNSKEIVTKYHSLLEAIPGFDVTLPELEIKTLSLNKVEVKHCLLNIRVQFDVITVPLNPHTNLKSLKKSYSFIPLDVSDDATKVFKCKTSIFNAILPAELCNILPKMVRSLIKSEVKTLPTLPVSKTESHLSTISELTYYENAYFFKMSQVHLGRFTDGLFKPPIKANTKRFINKFEWAAPIIKLDLFPSTSNKIFIPCGLSPRQMVYQNELRTTTSYKSQVIEDIPIQKQIFCTTLQSYDLRNWRVAVTFKPYDFNDMISAFKNYCNYSSNFILSPLSLITFYVNANRLSVNITLNKGNQETVFTGLKDYIIDIEHGDSLNILSNKIECFNGKIEKVIEIPASKKTSFSQVKRSIRKLRREVYVKLYKKCKSTANVPSECFSMPLNKIKNLDDFFRLLGWRKSLSSVFDGHSDDRVMLSITEMKNWISEINSRQAFLILLLINKKDTPNLVRFRPILLQGIAVNRITRVSELDMEIEVIERENLNSSLQIEGISYLPASNENKDKLLEELYWIAKTTASDYQRPFDESSEKHLKSLLERRKKLNPSYLRLMARYVGLGLLKSPLRK